MSFMQQEEKQRKKEKTKMTEYQAKEAIAQLGGFGLLKMMVGAKEFIRDQERHTVRFKVMGGLYIQIELNGKDLYNLEVFKLRSFNKKIIGQEEDLYFDQLREAFEKHTGLTLMVPGVVGINA